MAATVKAKLAGTYLQNVGAVGWALTSGTAPYARAFECTATEAAAILVAGEKGEVELELDDTEGASGKRRTFKGIKIATASAATATYLGGVVAWDRRWRWPLAWVRRSYNLPARTGDLRLVSGSLTGVGSVVGTQDASQQQTAPTYKYQAWTLRGEATPWTAQQVLEDVLKLVATDEKGGPAFRIEPGVLALSAVLPIEGLELDDDGASAVARVLGFLPGVEISLDQDGVAVVRLRSNGDERAEIKKLGPPVVGPALTVDVDRKRIRPASITSLFTRDHELRLNFSEGQTGTQSASLRDLENVVALPFNMTDTAGNTLEQGTWVKFADFLTMVAATLSTTNCPFGPLTTTVIRQNWHAPGLLENNYSLQDGTPDGRWLAVISAVREHYRQVFQVAPRYRARFVAWRANLLTVVDPVRGTRADAPAYFDFAVRPGQGVVLAAQDDPKKKALAWNVFASGDESTPWRTSMELAEGRRTGAEIAIKDEELGVFRVHLPSVPGMDSSISSLSTNPTMDPAGEGPWTFEFSELVEEWHLSVVLSATLVAPNDERQLYALEVTPDDAQKVTGASAKLAGNGALAPKQKTRTGAQVTTARCAWLDSQTDLIDRSTLGVVAGGDPPDLRPILTNYAELKAVARAKAASLYGSLVDTLEGSHVAVFDGDVVCKGSITSVSHELAPTGELLTTVALPGPAQPVDFYSLLPDSVRRAILRQVLR